MRFVILCAALAVLLAASLCLGGYRLSVGKIATMLAAPESARVMSWRELAGWNSLGLAGANSLGLAGDFSPAAKKSASMTSNGLSSADFSLQPEKSPRDTVANSTVADADNAGKLAGAKSSPDASEKASRPEELATAAADKSATGGAESADKSATAPAQTAPAAADKAAQITAMDRVVFYKIRLPRVLLAVCIGAALALSGALFQGCFLNPLVEPYILGASAGASFGAALCIITGAASVFAGAFGFALLAVAISCALAWRAANALALVLCGVITSSVFAAALALLKYTSDDGALREITFWMMGGLYYASWPDVRIMAAVCAVALGFCVAFAWQLNIISAGGRRPVFWAIFVLISTILCSFAVATVGIISWVGLMVPHAARMIFGANARVALPASALLGGIYVLGCDLLARCLIVGEIPLGVITSIAGAPFLAWLIRRRSRSLA